MVTAAVAGTADAVACNVLMWGEHVVSKHKSTGRSQGTDSPPTDSPLCTFNDNRNSPATASGMGSAFMRDASSSSAQFGLCVLRCHRKSSTFCHIWRAAGLFKLAVWRVVHKWRQKGGGQASNHQGTRRSCSTSSGTHIQTYSQLFLKVLVLQVVGSKLEARAVLNDGTANDVKVEHALGCVMQSSL